MTNRYPKISIVILNWQQWTETLNCLQSILENLYPNFECIIVDNGSPNSSEQNIVEWLENEIRIKRKAYNLDVHDNKYCRDYVYFNEDNSLSPVDITLLQTGLNLGYSGGNNVGIERALNGGCDYVLILNSDTIVSQKFILEITKAALDSNASVIGGLIKDSLGENILSSGESLLKASLSLGFLKPKIQKDLSWQVDCVNGSAMMLSREMLIKRMNQLGYYLNPHFFLYCEEIEMGFWCKSQGLKIITSKKSEVFHQVGGSSEGLNNPMPFYYLTRNRLLVARQYLKGLKLWLFYISFFLLRFMRSSYYFLLGKKDIARAIILGLLDGMKDVTGAKPTS